MITRTPKHDEFSRTLLKEDGSAVGRVTLLLDYTETFDDGLDADGGAVRYIAEPYQRENEIYVVRVEVRENTESPLKIQSETIYTGAAMDTIVELFKRLEAD